MIDTNALLISNGPGNPETNQTLIKNIKKIMDFSIPIFGICLGHQLLALAAGFQCRKMDYGHRSHNQPVRLVSSDKGYITSQNHGYEIVRTSLPKDWEIWFENINDQTVEGIKHKIQPFSSVQFHPESAGGPRDTQWVLDNFLDEVK